MRFSSIVSLLVVTASFALGGCAADLDPATAPQQEQGITESESRDRLEHARFVEKRSDLITSEADRARQVATFGEVTANPRIDAPEPSFGVKTPVLESAVEMDLDYRKSHAIP
jgi:hypothetical protein